jgi:ferritin
MYNSQLDLKTIEYPKASFEEFVTVAKACVKEFTLNNPIIEKLENNLFELKDYHKLLHTLFHQVYYSSSSFGLAGTMIDSRFSEVREYLMEHAEEEKEHWTWIINDLEGSGYIGKDPRESFPVKPTQAYISFAMFVAHKHPFSRLAMGYVLEDLSGQFGVKYGKLAAQLLGLTRDQVSFTVQHGELDQGHSQEILDVLSRAELTEYEWAHCCHTAKMTIELYKDMYRHAAII